MCLISYKPITYHPPVGLAGENIEHLFNHLGKCSTHGEYHLVVVSLAGLTNASPQLN